jgi:uncharacterized protein (TIGR02271 family)
MIDKNDIDRINGCDVYGPGDEKIGSVGQVYLDDYTGEPDWVTVNTGLFGMNENFVPLREATFTGDRVEVPYDKSTVKDSPNYATDAHLDESEERELFRHYGIGWDGDQTRGTAGGYDTDRVGTEGYDTSGPTTDEAMTRSEERVDVGTRSEEVGRARLRKYVVTEHVTQTVPVQKEKAVLEREPITDGNVGDATSGPDISEEEHEVTLHEERPVVSKTTEPVERVRLGKETTTDQETVSEEVRKEQIEAEGDIHSDR